MTLTDLERWKRDGAEFGWSMPAASAWKRLPIIRHVRSVWGSYQVERWYSHGPGSFGLRSGYDHWVLFGIWNGLEVALAQPTAARKQEDQ